MSNYNVDDIRNIAFCGHGSCGKTTLVDKLLVMTGTLNRPASVDAGNSICDFNDEEKEHKYSIESKVVHFNYKSKMFNVLDTPGYPDFIGQAISAMRGVDIVTVVINAQAGVEANTRRVFNEAKKAGVARFIVINKLDADHIDFKGLVEEIQEIFGHNCVLLNVPKGIGPNFQGVISTLFIPQDTSGALINPAEIYEPLRDSILEIDEQVMERYFEGIMPTEQELLSLLVRAVCQGNIVPILCISSKTGIGMSELLDAFIDFAPSPKQIKRTAKNFNAEQIDIQADPSAPLIAQVFKTRIDPFVQKISYIRIYSGTLVKDTSVVTEDSKRGIKIGPLFKVQANETIPVTQAIAGDIVAVTKNESLFTGITLGEFIMPPIVFPTPMVGLAVRPKTRGDEGRLSGALNKITQEDPTFKLDHDPQTKELVMMGMSELHLQIIQEKLRRRNKVEVETKEPKIPYKETVRAKGEGMYRHKKQTGGHGQFGEVHIKVMPFAKGTKVEEFCTKERFPQMKEYTYDEKSNFVWVNSIVGGCIPTNFLPAVEKGLRDRLEKGVLAGYPIQDVCVDVFFGKYHPVDSSEQSFKIAASMAFKKVFLECDPAILEPIVKMEITVPSDKVGDITSDISSRRGRVIGMDSAAGHFQTVNVEAPLAEVTTYARTLSSITGGQGSYTMEFSHYDFVLPNIQHQIIEKAALKEEEEESE